MLIGVYGSGSGELDPKAIRLAKELGEEIAKAGYGIVTGSCAGLPHQALLAAKSCGGSPLVGYSPAINIEEHQGEFGYPVEGFTELVFLPEIFKEKPKAFRLKARNLYSVERTDACVFIAGRTGSMNEFTLAYDAGKLIGLLEGCGGFTDMAQEIVRKLGKETGAKIISSNFPRDLIRKMGET
ncbi:MAG: hypothetical protein JSW08_02055 [archaeon]|nr:MAG: hypothetical protein JSW08_02055 [archaeon]